LNDEDKVLRIRLLFICFIVDDELVCVGAWNILDSGKECQILAVVSNRHVIWPVISIKDGRRAACSALNLLDVDVNCRSIFCRGK